MKRIKYTILLLLLTQAVIAQEILTKSEAVKLALEFNYDIKVANNSVDIAKNNADIMNSGYLPRLSTRAGVNYSRRSVQRDSDDGIVFAAGGNTYSYNSALELSYTLFDGLGRQYTFQQARGTAELSELQARQIIEQALLQLFSAYYEVARLTENEISQKQSLEISKDRLLRAKYGYDYGQNTQLDVLNAEVDVNNDSINYLTIIQQLENAKRDLNLLLGREVNVLFTVDTTVFYLQGLTLEDVVTDAKKRNVTVLQADKLIQNSQYDININRANWLPRVDLSASYDWSSTNYDEAANFPDQSIYGPVAGVNLSWDLFDGGLTKTRIQNSKIALESERIAKERTQQQLYRNLNNAWTVYETALFVLDAQRKNLETNQVNFDRTLEQYKLGQITSIVFRQAQVNLVNAQLSFNEAKYQAKIAEIALLQLSGNLLDSEF